jgi:hypothetical protein
VSRAIQHLSETSSALEPIPAPWLEWIARNLLRGVAEPDLVAGMAESGFSQDSAWAAVRDIAASPILAGAMPMARRLRNIEAMLDVRLSLANQRSDAPTVDRRHGLGADDFHALFYARNLPVVITDAFAPFAAYSQWTFDTLRDRFGDEMVELQANRKTEPVYEVFLKGHTIKMRFAEFIDRVQAGSESNEYYLTANDRLFENPAFAALLDDIRPFPPYFTQEPYDGRQFLWMGAKGCVSPLHRDRLNVFMIQVCGRKRVLLIDSTSTHVMYNFESFFSEVDAEDPDLDRFPDFGQARILEVTLEAGEALFIPANWWHHVRALEPSLNLSLTNFAFPNDFEAIFDRGLALG